MLWTGTPATQRLDPLWIAVLSSEAENIRQERPTLHWLWVIMGFPAMGTRPNHILPRPPLVLNICCTARTCRPSILGVTPGPPLPPGQEKECVNSGASGRERKRRKPRNNTRELS